MPEPWNIKKVNLFHHALGEVYIFCFTRLKMALDKALRTET